MGFFNRVFNATSSLSSPQQWLIDWVRGPESDSGVSVTADSALSYPPVWYAISKIAGHVGMLPLNLHRRDGERETTHASTHPVYGLMRTRPNRFQTASVFKENMMLHALLHGNGRAAIVRERGVASELVPLLPNCTYTCLVDGEKWHVVRCSDDWSGEFDGGPGRFRDGKTYKIPDRDVLHVPGLGFNGYSGASLLDVARDPIGLGLAAQSATSRSFKNGSRPGVVLEAPPNMFRDDKDAKEFIDQFNTFHEGLDNVGKAALLREGMKLSTVSMSASDAQWIEQRQFQRIDVAMMFGLETLPGDSESVSYNSLEQKNLAYLQNCLSKWLTKWEQECEWKLLPDRVRRTHYFNFDESELLRTDHKTKVETLAMGITARIISPNEAREKLGMNPYDGGDEFANPAITPGSGDDESADVDQMTPEDANRRAIVAHLRHMIGVECKNVLTAAGNKRNYVGWLDTYYAEKWSSTMRRAVESMGGDAVLAELHCEQSKSELLETAGTVAPDGLADAISGLVADWPERAESLADAILGELANV